jgi:NAD(P)-dependent dehydrogenase (short-subunit alcohol dehydrogenase family)
MAEASTSDIPKGRGRMDGKVAIVFGGGSVLPGWGNGKAAAVLYAVEGAKVVVVDQRLEAAQETVDLIAAVSGTAIAVGADAIKEEDVARAVKRCVDSYSRVDVLHNNIGGQGTGRSLDNITLQDWNETLARNVTTAMLTCREVVPLMIAQGGGAIVNISSIASIRHLTVPTTVYSTGKGALTTFTQNIALQHAKDNVRANCVLPGYIDTPFIHRPIGGRPNYEIKGFNSAAEYGAARNKVIPMGRMGTGWDVAYASLFLASDEAAYITGTTLVVDGGVTSTCAGV